MPNFRQGDIFLTSRTEKFGLTVVFGHLGYNFMRPTWEEFSQEFPSLSELKDPFLGNAVEPHQYQPGRWIWFIPDKDGVNQPRGMTDARLNDILGNALEWASINDIKKVITNGICNIDRAKSPHGATKINRESDDRRTSFLRKFAAEQELSRRGLKLTFISLNDVFVRVDINTISDVENKF